MQNAGNKPPLSGPLMTACGYDCSQWGALADVLGSVCCASGFLTASGAACAGGALPAVGACFGCALCALSPCRRGRLASISCTTGLAPSAKRVHSDLIVSEESWLYIRYQFL